jgi:hypothetical protein
MEELEAMERDESLFESLSDDDDDDDDIAAAACERSWDGDNQVSQLSMSRAVGEGGRPQLAPGSLLEFCGARSQRGRILGRLFWRAFLRLTPATAIAPIRDLPSPHHHGRLRVSCARRDDGER